jgi:uncharacterized membrane protein YsdA (DUF1294 family)/cold shock CspA family protein
MLPGPIRLEGTIVSWKDERGFGFISPNTGGRNVFVHIKSFPADSARPFIGQRVSFESGRDARGKEQAVRVAPIDVAEAPRQRVASGLDKPGNASYFAIPAFLVIYVACRLLWPIPWQVAVLYGALSVLGFVMYAVDKSAATAGRWRVPEQSLLLVGLAGGWPGAIVGQQVFRHKTKKTAFRWRFWGTVILNVFLFVGLSSPWFAQFVADIIRALVHK